MLRTATRVSLLLALAAVGCVPARRPSPPQPVASAIDTVALRAHTFFLAADLLAGRATGTPGAETAALYLESECRRLGLQPVGGAYRHPVPLEVAVPRRDATVLTTTDARGDSLFFRTPDDFVVTGGTPSTLTGFTGRAVWVGTGQAITGSPDDLPQLEGAVALTGGPVRQPAATVLHRRGAVGMAHLVLDENAYRLYAASRGRSLMTVADTAVRSSFFPPIPAVITAPSTSRALLEAAGAKRRLHLSAAMERSAVSAANIACLLPGRDADRRDTAIVYTAHYDHLGYSLPDERGDSLYNGFSDNAAGVAMLLSIAEAIRAMPAAAMRYSVLFLFFTGEERGLLGSDYFVARPPFPLGRMRALINLDAGAPPARPWSWRLAGGDNSALGALGMDVAATRGWAVVTSAATPNSDYFPFHREGVPAVFIIPGSAPYQGLSADSSRALREQWDRYHQPGDEWHEDFPFGGLQRYAEYALMIGLAVDRGEGSVRRDR